ncbi:LytR C-terminal domain-containing protein [Zhihengliuella salsuginis]|uniref:LytR/CpsA/Psr regulator C-terminal domain-containing protein n=1 Tax=Zhihengliuella salsuginis TaxID=578222 RepID=A0ABQ3GBM8_9MICC|nr:LytR C-terminal domain-containing protein [Zhihengliuella salsuginis]GHD00014.1 hypothetical protein GCM10008096_02770 [Zhihengliuella salsuginis]
MKSEDPHRWQGQRIVTEDELLELKAETNDPELVDSPEHFRRRLWHGIVLTFVLLLVAAVGVTAYLVLARKIELPFLPMGPEETVAAEDDTACPAGDFAYLDPAEVTVDVYNGTLRPGLAGDVRDDLMARGFVEGRVGNQQLSNRGAVTALVVSGSEGHDEALTVQRHFPGAGYAFEPRLGDGHIVVLLGEGYESLTPDGDLVQEAGPLTCD